MQYKAIMHRTAPMSPRRCGAKSCQAGTAMPVMACSWRQADCILASCTELEARHALM